MSNEKKRMNLFISEEAVEYIDSQCERYGMTRGAYLSYVVIEKKKADNIANTMVDFQKQLQEYQNELIKQGALAENHVSD